MPKQCSGSLLPYTVESCKALVSPWLEYMEWCRFDINNYIYIKKRKSVPYSLAACFHMLALIRPLCASSPCSLWFSPCHPLTLPQFQATVVPGSRRRPDVAPEAGFTSVRRAPPGPRGAHSARNRFARRRLVAPSLRSSDSSPVASLQNSQNYGICPYDTTKNLKLTWT